MPVAVEPPPLPPPEPPPLPPPEPPPPPPPPPSHAASANSAPSRATRIHRARKPRRITTPRCRTCAGSLARWPRASSVAGHESVERADHAAAADRHARGRELRGELGACIARAREEVGQRAHRAGRDVVQHEQRPIVDADIGQ